MISYQMAVSLNLLLQNLLTNKFNNKLKVVKNKFLRELLKDFANYYKMNTLKLEKA